VDKPNPTPGPTTKSTAEPAQQPNANTKSAVPDTPVRDSARLDSATVNVEQEVLNRFKQFYAAEKLRISERQRQAARESKAAKLNDLKKFSQNFKLRTPVPTEDPVLIPAQENTKQPKIAQKMSAVADTHALASMRLRLNQQFHADEKRRVSERQRQVARESKAVKLNDLKKFSQHFEVRTPVPEDLVPYLAKDETKQQEVVQKNLRDVQEKETKGSAA
jgi:hypothetical protein